MKKPLAHWKANFFTGLAVVLPALLSIGAVVWLFGTVSNFTDALLFFLPKDWTHERAGEGPMHWYWSLFALVLAVGLITLVGRFARHYLGKKLIQLADEALLRVPLLNKIYGAIKQINEAFTSSKTTAFQQVVLVEFPRAGIYSVGFITGAQHGEVQYKTAAFRFAYEGEGRHWLARQNTPGRLRMSRPCSLPPCNFYEPAYKPELEKIPPTRRSGGGAHPLQTDHHREHDR